MSQQPKYLENDGLRDSVVEIFYTNSPYRIEHLAKLIHDLPDMYGFQLIEENNSVFLQNDVYRIQVRPDCVSFNNISTYQRWPNYFPFIMKVIKAIEALPEITIHHETLRYISMYPEVSIFDNLNGQRMKLNAMPPIDGTEIRFKMGIADNEGNLGVATIRLTDNLPSNNTTIKTSVVDIQIEANCDKDSQEKILDFLHTQEKNLFFSILSEQFINSLGAHY